MDCSSPGSSVHEIFQARILGGLPFPPPGDLPNPGIKPVCQQVDSLPLSRLGSPVKPHEKTRLSQYNHIIL